MTSDVRRVTWPNVVAIVAALLAAGACASNPPSPQDVDGGGVSRIEQSLADYGRMGFLAGTSDFPVVGRVVTFRGAGDSAYVGLLASMPPRALKFARDHGLFAARYQVTATAVAGADTVARMDRREVVRVESFAETASDEERIFFQRFITLPPGTYEVTLTVRELTSRDQVGRTFQVDVPARTRPEGWIGEPVVAFRAVARQAYRQPPPLIISPRSTAAASRKPPYLVVEVYDESTDSVTVRAVADGTLLWEQTLAPTSAPRDVDGPRTALTTLPVSKIPPGLAELTVSTGGVVATRSPVLVALDDVWAFARWDDVVRCLAYALPSDSLEAWETASPPDRARMWTAFWEATDLDPATPGNEFLDRYFDRMSRAQDRYGEPGVPGWRSDRGRAYVQLGPPDVESVQGGGETGEPLQIDWRYGESLPFPVLLHYVDANDFGRFRLDSRSRLVLRNAARDLRALESSGEWTDTRNAEDEDDEGIE